MMGASRSSIYSFVLDTFKENAHQSGTLLQEAAATGTTINKRHKNCVKRLCNRKCKVKIRKKTGQSMQCVMLTTLTIHYILQNPSA